MPETVLTVDFGTTNTVAVLGDRLVTVDGLPRMPSAVLLGLDGRLVVGWDAMRLGWATPDRLELRPKSRIDEDELLLGGTPVPTGAAIQAVLGRVVAEAARQGGTRPDHLIVTHPADWGPLRLGRLRMAAAHLALSVSMVAEPVAAAAGAGLGVGETLLVLDFGGGTCDAAVVRGESTGLAVLACAGLPDLGGDDLDQRLVDHVLARRPVPDHPRDRLTLRSDAQQAKELLSGQPVAGIATPGRDEAVRIDRPTFEQLVGAHLDRAVELARRVAATANVPCGRLLLVGGSARIPLLAKLLAERTGMDVRLAAEPESAVCLGAAMLPAKPKSEVEQPTAGPRRRLGLPVGAALGLSAAVIGSALTFGAPDPVAGTAIAGAVGDQAATGEPAPSGLPPAVDGRPVRNTAKPVRAVHRLRQPVQHDKMTVTVDSVTVEPKVGSGQAPAAGFRWVVVNITVQPTSQYGIALPGITSKLTLLDDRGQRIANDSLGSISGCTARTIGSPQVPQCAVMQVPNKTPVTGVLYEESTEPADQGALLFPVDLPATGDTPLPPAAGELGGSPVEIKEPQAVLRVRADLVENASPYWPDESSALPGHRIVVARLYMEAVSVGSKPKDSAAQIVLIDDRGVAIRPMKAAPTDCPGFDRDVKPDAPVYACLAYSVAADTPVQGLAFSTIPLPGWGATWPWLKARR